MGQGDVVSPEFTLLRQLMNAFIADGRIHADKEDGVLIPAVMFAHDIRRSDSESGAPAL